MAKKTYLGIDIGYDTLKLILVRGGEIRKAVCAGMPERLVREGRILSMETMAELLRSTMKKAGIRASQAALVLPDEVTFTRSLTMPFMTAEQLEFNLPYEFRDYIDEDLKKYVFDYAMITPKEKLLTMQAGEGAEMELIASAVSRELIGEYREMLRKAGLELAICAPRISALSSLIRAREAEAKETGEYAFLDLGYHSVRLDMFRSDVHDVTRELESGLRDVQLAAADALGEDPAKGRQLLRDNVGGCQEDAQVQAAEMSIAVELQRAVNFYRFSNPDSNLEDLWVCGGGAYCDGLIRTLSEVLDLKLHRMEELFVSRTLPEEASVYAGSYGITQS